jgi:hypothetical protein
MGFVLGAGASWGARWTGYLQSFYRRVFSSLSHSVPRAIYFYLHFPNAKKKKKKWGLEKSDNFSKVMDLGKNMMEKEEEEEEEEKEEGGVRGGEGIYS